jgi:hypothetical protein
MNDLDRRSEDWSADDAAYEPGWYALANRAPVSEEYQVFHPKASRKAEPPRRGLDELLELLVESADPHTRRTAADAAIGLIEGIGIDEGSFDHLLDGLGRAEASELLDPDTLARLGGVIGTQRLKAAVNLPDERRIGAERLLSVLPTAEPAQPHARPEPEDAGTEANDLRAREAALDRREASLIEREAAVLEREAALQEREAELRRRESVLAHPAGEPGNRGASQAERERAFIGSRFHRQRAG